MNLGRSLIVLGLVLVVVGILVNVGRFGHLPGDIEVRGKNSVFYFPVVTCLVISVVLSFVLWLFGKR